MLQAHIEENEKYSFVVDRRDRLMIVLVTQDMLTVQGAVEPLWHREAGDDRSLNALLRWVAVRRARWQEWGALAQAIGRSAFYMHMRDLMAAEPVSEVVGTVVQPQEDPCEIAMGEMTQGPAGMCIEVLYRHRFSTDQARNNFFDWFYMDENHKLAEALLQIGYCEGTSALGEALDQIAARASEPLSRAERRRRAKAIARTA